MNDHVSCHQVSVAVILSQEGPAGQVGLIPQLQRWQAGFERVPVAPADQFATPPGSQFEVSECMQYMHLPEVRVLMLQTNHIGAMPELWAFYILRNHSWRLSIKELNRQVQYEGMFSAVGPASDIPSLRANTAKLPSIRVAIMW